jgi:tRNA dimethylallyltransferase
MAEQRILLIAGPTASGKSVLALAAAEAFDGLLINADSIQIYRELEILSNRPREQDFGRVPHRLYGMIPAGEPCSAGLWRQMAVAAIREAFAASKLPIVVGGTGLYFRALVQGLAPVQEIPAAVRSEARALHRQLGGVAFRQLLAARDPETVAKIGPSDTQRLIRAYEVLKATDRSLADWQREATDKPFASFAGIVLEPPREDLYAAIDARFDLMMGQGGLQEARALDNLGLAPDLPVMKAVGVRELIAHLHGDLPLDDAVALAKKRTRNYAKRQMTWFRWQFPRNFVSNDCLKKQQKESFRYKIFTFIREFLLTGAVPTV